MPVPMSMMDDENSFWSELTCQLKDERFLEAFNILSRFINCTEHSYIDWLKLADRQGHARVFSGTFFKNGIVNQFSSKEKVSRLRNWLQEVHARDPEDFMWGVWAYRNLHPALYSDQPVDEVTKMLEDRPEASKLSHLVFISCLYVLDPVVPMKSLSITEDRLCEILDIAIDIDLGKLTEELRKDSGFMQ